MTTQTKTPLPDRLAKTPAVGKAQRHLANAVAAVETAQRATREARAAVEAAPATDQEALRAAVAAGEPNPAPTVQTRKAEAEAATTRVDTANALAREAADRFRAAIAEHREELSGAQAPRVDEAATAVTATLDTLADQLDTLALEAGVWRELYAVEARLDPTPADERSRMLGREPTAALPNFGPVPNAGAEALAALHAATEELRTQPIPIADERAEERRQRHEQRAQRRGAQRERAEGRAA